MNTNIDLSVLDGLSEEERKVALEILQQYATTGESELFEDLTDIDYDEVPVDIETFLHDRQYLGNGLYDAEGRFTLFPYWEKCLQDIFPTNTTTKYNNIVFTGAIGLGKTLVADIILLYMLYRLLCLKDPYTYYGMQVIDKISISFMNITIENAKGVALDKMNQLILSSKWFMAHGEMAGTTNLIYRPSKHIELIAASSNNQIVGRALFCLDGSTLIETTDGTYKISELVDKQFRVFSVDQAGNIIKSNYCTAKPTVKTDKEYQIELEDETILKCTANHRLMLKDDSYKEAQYLTESDELMTVNSVKSAFEKMKIKSIKLVTLDTPKQYYDIIEAKPYNNFFIKTNAGSIVSHNCSFEDEANFSLFSNPEKQKQKMMKIITQIDARMKSRFMRTKPDGSTYLPTLNIIASSKDTEQSFLEEYIENKRKNDSTTTLIVDEPQWVVDARKDSPIKFWVALGDKFKANELLPVNATADLVDEYRNKGYIMWQVPIGYLETFQQNLDEAICSIIGVATASSLKYISGEKLLQTKTASYRNPFTKDIIEVGNAIDDYTQYSSYFDLSAISEQDKARPLFIHLDMSTGSKGKGDKTGIAGVWITGRTSNQAAGGTAPTEAMDTSTMDMAFKLAFSVSVKAPSGASISFSKNRNFIRWLRDQGFAIKGVSMDTFQSANIFQDLQADGFKTEIISVDRVQKDANGHPICLPYHYFRSAIYERRLMMYQKCDLLTDEIIGLERKSDGHVDHTKEGINSKDQCDAVCGATWLASKWSAEYSYNYGDNLVAALDANYDYDHITKQQLSINFQEELAKIYMRDHPSEEKIDQKQIEEVNYYKDIIDGILPF